MTPNAKEEACATLAAAFVKVIDLLRSEEGAGKSGPQLYSIPQLAERFGKSRDTIRRWMTNGEFGAVVRTGKTQMVTEDGLQKFIAEHSGPCQKRQFRSRDRTGRVVRGMERI